MTLREVMDKPLIRRNGGVGDGDAGIREAYKDRGPIRPGTPEEEDAGAETARPVLVEALLKST